ncbi:ATP-binding protein [Sphingomonas sp.]|uniref:ATP-binding protein n=1 Tax=Sphingomonas sp. TaxID=28214 RepID=UPI003CC56410
MSADALRIAELEARLAEAEETIEAIRSGEVDALVIGGDDDRRIFTLDNADRPYRLLIEQMREGAVTLSTDGLVLYCNHAFADLVGEPSSLVTGTRFARFMPAAADALARLLRDGGQCEVALSAAQGRMIPVRLSLSALPLDDAAAMCAVVTDLSQARDLADARQALAVDAARRETEERVRLAVDNAEVGFWDVDLVNDLLIWPPRTKAMFGISPDVPVTMADFYDGLHPDDRAATGAAYDGSRDPATRALYDVEYRTIGKEDGVVRWLAAKGRGVFDDAGRCLRVAGTVVDITARKAAEAALRELNDTLELRVAARTAELADANDRLQVEMAERARTEEALRHAQKLEAIGQLTGGVAHDFNNLLTIIRSSVDLLRRRELPEDRKRRYIDAISDTADRAAKLTAQLLAYARKQPLRPETFDAAALIRSTAEMLHTTVGSRVAVVTDIRCQPALVDADANQFETALLNMAVNARDAMAGEGRLTITVDSRADAIGAPFVAIAVADTGRGIPADTLERIFEPFYTTKEVGKGTGLGLSQVYGFAKQSGGEIRVESEPGRGTIFTLMLPQAQAGVAAETTAAESGGGLHGGHLLLVEDNEQVGEVAAQLFEELGFTVLRAGDAAQALAMIDATGQGAADFDLVFSDVVMPGGMSGVDLARDLRRRRPDLRVILTTGYSEALADGGVEGVELLRKPYSVEALSRVLRRVTREAAPAASGT